MGQKRDIANTRFWQAGLANGLVAAVVILLSISASAQSVLRSDFVFNFDNSLFSSNEFDFRPYLDGVEEVVIPDMTFQDEAPVYAKGLKARVQYKFNSGSSNVFLGADHVFASENLQVDLSIREIYVDSVLVQEVGGAQVYVRVQARCDNIQVTLPAKAGKLMGVLRTGVSKDGQLELGLSYLEALWPEEAWKVADFSCQGSAGFKEKIKDRLRSYLKTPAAFTDHFREALKEKLQVYQDGMRSWFLAAREIKSDFNNMRMFFLPQKIALRGEDKFSILGEIQFWFSGATANTESIMAFQNRLPADKTSGKLFLPEGLLTALERSAVRAGVVKVRKHGHELAPWQELRSQIHYEVFVLPELQLFKKNADFLFDFGHVGEPQFTDLPNGANGVIRQQIQSQLTVQSWAPVDGVHSKFVFFETPFDGDFQIDLVNSQIRILFTRLDLNIKATWDPEYYKRIRFDKVDTKIIKEKLTESMTKTGVTIQLAPLVLTQKKTLQAQKIRRENGAFVIEWK